MNLNIYIIPNLIKQILEKAKSTDIIIKNEISEIWKPIEGVPSYEISNKGNCRRLLKTGKHKAVNHHIRNDDYLCIFLRYDGKIKEKTVHSLVVDAFQPENPEGKPCINHKDGNKHNNNNDNLERCTHKENTKHANDTGLVNSKEFLKMGLAAFNSFLKENGIKKKDYDYKDYYKDVVDMFLTDPTIKRKIIKEATGRPMATIKLIKRKLTEEGLIPPHPQSKVYKRLYINSDIDFRDYNDSKAQYLFDYNE